MDANEFVKAVNSMRLANKNKWYYFNATVNGSSVQIKAFGTWLQLFIIDGVGYSNVMSHNVTEFKMHLKTSIQNKDTAK